LKPSPVVAFEMKASLPSPPENSGWGVCRSMCQEQGKASSGKRLLGEIDRPGAARERGVEETLLHGDGEGVLVLALALEDLGGIGGVDEVPEVAGTHHAFLRGLVVGAGQETHGGITGAVGEEPASDPCEAGGADVPGLDGLDAICPDAHGLDALFEEEGDAGFGTDEVELAGVVVHGAALGVAGAGVLRSDEFFDDVADVRVGLLSGLALGPHADFGAGVAAKHGTVLDEGDAQAVACCGKRGAAPGDPAAHDNEIELAGVIGLFRQAELIASPGGEGGRFVRRDCLEIGTEHDGVAPALESGEVVQGDARLGGDFDHTAILPVPFCAFGAEGGREGAAVDDDLESARGAGRVPRRDPVAGPDPDAMRAWRGEPRGCDRVLHGHAKAVGEKVRRAHDLHGLLVDVPSAGIRELFGFEEHVRRGACGSQEGEGSQEGQDKSGESEVHAGPDVLTGMSKPPMRASGKRVGLGPRNLGTGNWDLPSGLPRDLVRYAQDVAVGVRRRFLCRTAQA
jgi:hypothetical protein